ncbi:MAG: hypothetical protein OSB25_11110 [Salibacteraceae bacterium]|nr:hypothetical protein [Salibacteraceae bacterium]|tara:strand:- start:49363 stop:49803 length:441 start_codon:yes stop_codon:yes gene_type:complete
MRYFFYVLLSIIVITSCVESASESKEVKTENKERETNKRMKANAETSEGMLMMKHMIISFNEMNEEDKNYAVLLGELSYQCDYIIKNCTMKGDDYTELHKMLEPILASIQKAKNADSNEKTDAELKIIVSITELFFEIFESDQAQV